MDITLNQLLEGKATVIKKKNYLTTKEYVEPFLDIMSKYTDNFIAQVKLPDQMTLTDDMKDFTANRVYIQAVLPEDYWEFENHVEVIGMVYGLDVRKPIYKLFRGGINQACTNLCVFNPTFLYTQEIEPETHLDFSPIKNLMELTSDMRIILSKMKSTFLDRNLESIQSELGRWIDFTIKQEFNSGYSKVKLSSSLAIDTYKSLYVDNESKYYIPEDEQPSLFNIYNAFTEIISHDQRDIMNTVDKTLLLGKMLNVK